MFAKIAYQAEVIRQQDTDVLRPKLSTLVSRKGFVHDVKAKASGSGL